MVSGQPDDNQSINNSGLGRIKTILCGKQPFGGDERFLHFGSEYHRLSLTPKQKPEKVWVPYNEDEKLAMGPMVKATLKHPLFIEFMSGNPRVEQLIRQPDRFGIHAMHGTLDISKDFTRSKRRGLDLKTTSATTEEEFIKKAIKLDYVRQDVVYCELDDLTEPMLFLGCCKKNMGTKLKPYHPLFVFDPNDFKKERDRARDEAEFLLTFFKRFGVPGKTKAELDERIVRSKLNSEQAWGRTAA